MRFPRKIIVVGGSLAFTIPKDLADYLGLQEGGEIIVEDYNNKDFGPYAAFWSKDFDKNYKKGIGEKK